MCVCVYVQTPPPARRRRALQARARFRPHAARRPPGADVGLVGRRAGQRALVGLAGRERGAHGRRRGVVLSVEGAEADCFWWWWGQGEGEGGGGGRGYRGGV